MRVIFSIIGHSLNVILLVYIFIGVISIKNGTISIQGNAIDHDKIVVENIKSNTEQLRQLVRELDKVKIIQTNQTQQDK